MLRSLILTGLTLTLATTANAGGVVTNCTEADLRAALVGGGTVTFTCDGTITLASTLVITNNTVFDASGHSLALSGSNAVRVLYVNSGVTFSMTNLTVTLGQSDSGAGLFNAGGNVNVASCTFSNNQALGPTGPVGGSGGGAYGGAIYSRGDIGMTNCTFQSNAAIGGNGGGAATIGGFPGAGGEALGGGVLNAGGALKVFNCTFAGNQAACGFAGGGVGRGYRLQASASGGGICSTGSLQIAASLFISNRVDGASGSGGAIYHEGGGMTSVATTFTGNTAATIPTQSPYYGGPGLPAFGGAVCNAAVASLIECAFAANSAAGGQGTDGATGLSPTETWEGGEGFGGGVCNRGTTDVVRCTFVANFAQGGKGATIGPGPFGHGAYRGGAGGMGVGGALAATTGTLSSVNITIIANQAVGGAGGDSLFTFPDPRAGGKGGDGVGGAIYATNSVVTFTNCTLAANNVVVGAGGVAASSPAYNGLPGSASAGGIAQTNSTVVIQSTIVTGNMAGDVTGAFVGNHNLIGVNARLAPLAANGGPTLTLALMPDSPAIDAADAVTSPPTDQRGVTRPYGPSPDIGAYEWNATSFYADFRLRPPVWTNTTPDLLVVGPPTQSFRLQTSTNLAQWSDLATNVTNDRGLRSINDSSPPGVIARFYRTASP